MNQSIAPIAVALLCVAAGCSEEYKCSTIDDRPGSVWGSWTLCDGANCTTRTAPETLGAGWFTGCRIEVNALAQVTSVYGYLTRYAGCDAAGQDQYSVSVGHDFVLNDHCDAQFEETGGRYWLSSPPGCGDAPACDVSATVIKDGVSTMAVRCDHAVNRDAQTESVEVRGSEPGSAALIYMRDCEIIEAH